MKIRKVRSLSGRRVNLGQLAGDSGRAPRQARREALRLGQLIATVTAFPSRTSVATDLPCMVVSCTGRLWARRDGDEVQWWCPRCGKQGLISGWQQGSWNHATPSLNPPR